jgi:3-hydroxyacyl-[acyl-carrier-protein] dehydratase
MLLEYFQMLDHVKSIDFADQSIVVESVVPEKSPIFEGHFPGMPLMPGVLLIESMAQASGILYMALSEFKVMPFLMSVDTAKMRQFVNPSETLQINSKIEHEGSGFVVSKCSISVDGKRVCNSQLKFATRSFDEVPTLEHIMELAERVSLQDAIDTYKAGAQS